MSHVKELNLEMEMDKILLNEMEGTFLLKCSNGEFKIRKKS